MAAPFIRIHILARPRREGSHVSAGTVHLATGMAQEPDAGPLAVPSGRKRLPTPARVALFCFLGMAILIGIAALTSGCGSAPPSPRPAPPVPDLPARADALAAARGLLPALDELDVRLRWGAGRVEFYEGAALADHVARLHFRSGPAIALGLNDAPIHVNAERGAAAVSRAAAAPVAGRNLETTRDGRRGARLETVAGSGRSFDVVSEPGAAEVSRRVSLWESQRSGRPHEPTAPGAAPGPAIPAAPGGLP
jgi:hypothetical protein